MLLAENRRVKLAEARELLGNIADIAHSGGLLGASESQALVYVRALSLRYWNRSGTEDEARERITLAVTAAKEGR